MAGEHYSIAYIFPHKMHWTARLAMIFMSSLLMLLLTFNSSINFSLKYVTLEDIASFYNAHAVLPAMVGSVLLIYCSAYLPDVEKGNHIIISYNVGNATFFDDAVLWELNMIETWAISTLPASLFAFSFGGESSMFTLCLGTGLLGAMVNAYHMKQEEVKYFVDTASPKVNAQT